MLLGAQGALSKWTPLSHQIKMGFRVESRSFKVPWCSREFQSGQNLVSCRETPIFTERR